MVSGDLVRAWEGAYRKYGQAAEMAARKPEADPAVAWEMASASLAVAKAWRDFTALPTLPWWVLAAVESAADAFEAQAQEWKALEDGEG